MLSELLYFPFSSSLSAGRVGGGLNGLKKKVTPHRFRRREEEQEGGRWKKEDREE